MAKAKLIVLSVEDRPGTVAAAIAALGEAGVNIESVFGWGPQGVLQLIVDSPKKAAKALSAAGVACSEAKADIVELPNKPGSLHAHLAKLAKKGVNLRSLWGTSGKSARKAVIAWTVHT
jgi:hypothetical protein